MIRTLLILLCLAACTAPVKLRNASTGDVATCGPYVDTWTTPDREGRCISDYQRQGFERVP